MIADLFVNPATLAETYIAQYGNGTAVKIGPHTFVCSNHQSHPATITYKGVTYNVSNLAQVQVNGSGIDLQTFDIDADVAGWHLIADPYELPTLGAGTPIVLGGWGDTSAAGTYSWAGGTQAEKWGRNTLTSYTANAVTAAGSWGATFTTGAGLACPVISDSGGGAFVETGGRLALIGIIINGGGNPVASGTGFGGVHFGYPVIEALREAAGIYPRYTVSGSTRTLVRPTLHMPTLTGASTAKNTQSSSGLVGTPSVSDSNVTHFYVAALTGGRLYLNDGTTERTESSWISKAQAAAGLKWTPVPGQVTTGTVTLYPAAGDDLGNGDSADPAHLVTASITVSGTATRRPAATAAGIGFPGVAMGS